jgi:thioredoxin reductase
VSFGFTPNAGIAAALGCGLTDDLAVQVDVGQRTTIDGVLAAGEVTGVAGASVAALEGAEVVGDEVVWQDEVSGLVSLTFRFVPTDGVFALD